MGDLSSTENGQNAVYRVESSLTLTNPPHSTPTASRDTSVERQKLARQARPNQLNMLSKLRGSVHNYLSQELDGSYMSVVIILCFFISGLIDSVAFNSWNCFVDMQTGNTIFAALGLGGQPKASHSQQYYKSLTSIGAFCLGTLFFNILHRYPTGLSEQPSCRRRGLFIVSFGIQTVFITTATILVSVDLVSNQPFVPGSFSSGSKDSPSSITNFLDLCPVSLLSFQAAGQVTLSRLLGVVELPTIVLSTLYHDFTSDLLAVRASWRKSSSGWEFFAGQQRRQGRRLACILALFTGGIIGGEMYKSRAGMAGALWLAAGFKLVIVMAWCFWKGEIDAGAQTDMLPR
ncbi:hypothetical protein A1O3_03613 [Capronia epimyces CBS 606.96]|uniref:DUF1275 domain protein n=1 Tax=Capronia epimyces CBS 606.96 TaxID=1182542 RepID=W9YAH6_9EURO|nr:uncharacterized protein A1O3_03613 [Capronia epimyces CBS 606.96]EXJ86660.1 hypothetical protein A1O3_03613 [Capronia epimyces CBS 606.96]